MKIIIFRCDRIGDFLMSSIFLNNLKKINNKIEFTVVCSEKNINYVKKSSLVKDVMIIPKNTIRRILFFFHIFRLKFDKSIVLDGKKFSIISSILINCTDKILLTNKNTYKKIFNIFFNKIFYSEKNINKIDELISISSYLGYDLKLSSYKYKNLISEINQNVRFLLNNIKKFNILHFDEKWIFNNYIKTYVNIEPNNSELLKFSIELTEATSQNLIITTGLSNNNLILFLKSKFKKIDNNVYQYNSGLNSIFLIDSLDICNLEYLISKTDCVITCHGAPSHLTNMYDKNLIDIIDGSEYDLFKNWTYHFTNHTLLEREPFKILKLKILDIFIK